MPLRHRGDSRYGSTHSENIGASWGRVVKATPRLLYARERYLLCIVDSSWNMMANGDAREGKWRGNWRMERVGSTLHTTSEHGVSSITTADAHTSATSSRRNWRPSRFKWTTPFRRKTKSAFCVCAITFQTQSTTNEEETDLSYRHITLSEKANICSYWQINKVKWNSFIVI